MNHTSPLTFKLLALKSIKGVGPATLKDVIEFVSLETSEMLNIINRRYSFINESSYSLGSSIANKEFETADRLGHRIISIFDKCYPESLLELKESPPILYISGNFDYFNEKNIAVIGTREPTSHGIEITEKITSWLCNNDWNIVSGLAKGIDSIAHRVCLNQGMKTTAVLAQGLDTKVYPSENRGLAEEILNSGGSLVSEYPYGTTVRGPLLVQRDKIQAALSAGVVLVQSGEKGGSLHASREILKYERPLIVVGQSKKDTLLNESKAKANLILLGDNDAEKIKILKINQINKEKIIKLHTRYEYPVVLETLINSYSKICAKQKYKSGVNEDFQF